MWRPKPSFGRFLAVRYGGRLELRRVSAIPLPLLMRRAEDHFLANAKRVCILSGIASVDAASSQHRAGPVPDTRLPSIMKYHDPLRKLVDQRFPPDGHIKMALLFHTGMALPDITALHLKHNPEGVETVRECLGTNAGIPKRQATPPLQAATPDE